MVIQHNFGPSAGLLFCIPFFGFSFSLLKSMGVFGWTFIRVELDPLTYTELLCYCTKKKKEHINKSKNSHSSKGELMIKSEDNEWTNRYP